MERHTIKILQQMFQDFESVSDHFTLRIKGVNSSLYPEASKKKIENI